MVDVSMDTRMAGVGGLLGGVPQGLFLLLLWLTTFSQAAEVMEYCQFQSFEGKCSRNEVILIRTAQYGRMRTGKCIAGEGYIGCKADVTPYLDSLCSGRHNCIVDVTEIRDVAQPCKKDFTSYLEVSYECVRISRGKSKVCHHAQDVQLAPTSGFLATVMTADTGLGTLDCPWVVKASIGQRLQLSVFDFGKVVRDESGKWIQSNYNSHNCPVHLVLHDGSAISEMPLCGGGNRERHLVTSKENSVKIYLIMHMSEENLPHFLISYSVDGCPNIRTPMGAYVSRDGDNAVVRCNTSQETWYITCDGHKWIGDVGNCTNSSWGLAKFFGTRIPVTQGILIAIAIGVALGIVFGSTLLASVLFCKRKCRPTHHHVDQDSDDVIDHDQSNYPSLLKHGGPIDPRRSAYTGTQTTSGSKTGTGTTTGPMFDMSDDMRAPEFHAPPHGGGTLSYDSQYGRQRSHIYECPNPPKRSDDTTADPPVYFDLDPEASRYKSSRGKPL